jgi:N-acetylneuraminate lyase
MPLAPTRSFGGVLPAVVTPFDDAGRFRRDAFETLLGRCYGAGADGVYICGTTGEGPLQPAPQRMRVAEAAVELSPPGAQVIVHVGAPSTDQAVELARHAGRAGAAAVSSLPPVGGYGFPEIRAYYERIAGEAGVPLFVYYYPEIAPSLLGLDQLLEICALPGVAGIKLTDFDLYRLSILRREGVTVFNGRDEVFAAGLLMGANGGIGTFYNLLPAHFVRIHALARAGDWAGARALQDEVNDLVRALSTFPLMPAVKQILHWSGLDCGHCLQPRLALTPDQAGRLRHAVARVGLVEALVGG